MITFYEKDIWFYLYHLQKRFLGFFSRNLSPFILDILSLSQLYLSLKLFDFANLLILLSVLSYIKYPTTNPTI